MGSEMCIRDRVTNIGLPALLIYSVLKLQLDLGNLFSMIQATVVFVVLMSVVTLLFLKLIKKDFRQYLSVLVNPNAGNLGIPVVFALLGEEGLALAVVVSTIIQISHFSLGVWLMSGHYSPQQFITNGPVLALLMGGLLLGFDIQLPAFAMRTLDILAGITLPLMLLMLGQSLSKLSVTDARVLITLGGMALYRPMMGCLVAWCTGFALGLSHLESTVLMLQAAMPVAVISYMLATKYKGPTTDVASLIMLSTPVSLLVTALIAYYFV